MIKEATKPGLFQWIRGERMGQIVKSTGETIVDGNIEFLIFEDGSECNMQLIGEWIVPIESTANTAIIVDPPQNQMTKQPQRTEPAVVSQPQKTSNPVFDLLDRSKKKNSKMEVSITVSMPSDELIRVIDDSYENGTRLIGEYLVNSVDQNVLMKQVEAILFKKVEEVTKKRKKANESIV